jgi:peptide/nickel transport system permease protein
MAGSIPASVTTELPLPPGQPEPVVARPMLPRRLLRTPAAVLGSVITAATVSVGALAGTLAPSDPLDPVGPPLQSPSTSHLMGTDDLGRDLLSGVVYGARTSMLVVAAVVGIAAAIGVPLGAVAGYRGGLADDVHMRVTDMFQSIPRFFLAIFVVALFGAELSNLILALGLSSWPMLARVVRSEALSLRDREFVEAARSEGASDSRIMVHHVLPNVLPAALVVASLLASTVILLEASLSFIGLGDPNVMSWGYLINNAQRFVRTAWWLSVFPGLAIVLAVLGLNLLSDAVADLLNPGSSPPAPRRLGRRWGRAAAVTR